MDAQGEDPIWFTELGMDDYNFLHEFQINSFDDDQLISAQNAPTAAAIAPSFSHDHLYPCNLFDYKTTNKHQKPNYSWPAADYSNLNDHQYSSKILNFQVPTVTQHFSSKVDEAAASSEIGNYAPNPDQIGTKRRYSSFSRLDHVRAEQKRREILTQRFISLSVLLPGLKKMDKVSILGDAVKHVKKLQDQVKELEEQIIKTNSTESVVINMKKSRDKIISIDDNSTYSDDQMSDGCGGSDNDSHDATAAAVVLVVPEIQARVADKDVLIRIQCKKQEGGVAKIMREIENLDLSVMNCHVLPFGNSILDITIISQMDTKFSTTVKDIVENLRLAFLQYCK